MEKAKPYFLSMGLVFLMSCVGRAIHHYFEPTNLVMLYLLAVVISASLWGRGPAIATSVVSVLVFDVLFVPPLYHLRVSDTQYILTFIGLFIVGVMISQMASQLRRRAIEANRREAQTEVLYKLSRDLTATLSLFDALAIIQSHVSKIAGSDAILYIHQAGAIKRWTPQGWISLNNNEESVVGRILKDGAPISSEFLHYIPMKVGSHVAGVLAYSIMGSHGLIGRDVSTLLDAMANQCALAIERINLLEENRNMELLREKEKLYTTLLNSISHDLRTPLVAITGTLSSLMDDSENLDQSSVRELIETALGESRRLNKIVGDLLDITRIEAGALKTLLKPCDVSDIISVALDQVKEKLGVRDVQLDIAGDLPDVLCDMPLIVKAIANVLDNAVKYSPADTPIAISAGMDAGGISISVRDQGRGIDAGEMRSLFKKFFRGEYSRHVPGLGLGLSISKGIIEAHKGTIQIGNNPEHGTVVVITLPSVVL